MYLIPHKDWFAPADLTNEGTGYDLSSVKLDALTAWHPVNVFDHILLMPEQEDLLARMVEAARSLPVDQREKFMLLETNGGDFLIHHGLPGRIY